MTDPSGGSSSSSGSGGINFNNLISALESYTTTVEGKIKGFSTPSAAKGGTVSLKQMFELQLSMNKLSQFIAAATNVLSAMNTGMSQVAQNIK
ncbi:DUF5407 family protein [Simkania negevensis]|uniref:DUF5407 family protein n=1 Tax=Simkania negevensis TaxID=83561 RepID=A0ABS3ASA5_9BACT|nr:DUF5407 family protein [Simkania negevensis]